MVLEEHTHLSWFYRDCNGAEVNVISETIRVWNHPSITEITLNFVSEQIYLQVVRKLRALPQCLSVELEVQVVTVQEQLNK